MITDIPFSGYSANPADTESADGSLALSLGVINEDGALRPILPPSLSSISLPAVSSGKVLCIHKTSEFTHYIILDGSAKKLYWMDSSSALHEIELVYFSTATAEAIGNTVVVLAEDGIQYYLWRNGAYVSLGYKLPDITLSLGLVGHPRLFSQSDDSKSTFKITFNGISSSAIHNEFTEENKRTITDQVMAKVNKFIKEQSIDQGRFCFPFLVRYALRLYDGSLVCHSAPVLMNPSTTSCPVVFWNRIRGKSSYTEAELDLMLVAADLDCALIDDNAARRLSDWEDIIQSVDIFVSKPIYTFDQEGECTSFFDTDDFQSKFIGRVFDGLAISNSQVVEDHHLGSFSSLDFHSRYLEYLYSQIYTMYFEANRTYPGDTLHLPEFSSMKVKESVENTSTFYLLKSIPIKDLIEIFVNKTDPWGQLVAALNYNRYVIPVEKEYLQSLLTREVMTDDYLTHDRLVATKAYSYNSRLNLSGIKREPFSGFSGTAMHAYLSHGAFNWSVTDNTINISVDSTFQTYLTFDVYIKENGKEYKVSATSPQAEGWFLSRTNTNGIYQKLSSRCFFFYPNVNAHKLVVKEAGTPVYVIDLHPHEFLNGAYALLDYDTMRLNNYSELSLPTLPHPLESLINVASKVYTSEVNNPFFFPVTGINTIGTGRVLGICSAAKAMSQGQFGAFPLYAFTDEGVWAMSVSDTGSYSAKQPISRDVVINPESITQIDSAVLFATDRGIMMVSGSELQCLSDSLNAAYLFTIADLPNADALLSVYNSISSDSPLTLPEISLLPFREFLLGCRMIYDYIHQRIIVYNPSVKYAYVYSLKSHLWGMMRSEITDNVNSYPEALALSGSKVMNFSCPTADKAPSFVITRPFKLGDANVFKTILTIIQRGFFVNGHVSQVLYGSNDYIHWQAVWSSSDKYLRGFRGTPYKAFRLVLIGSLDKEESIFGFTAEYNPRQQNQPR